MLQYLKPKIYPFNSCFNIGKRRYSSTAVDFPTEKHYNSSKQRETRRKWGGGGSVPVRALWVVSAIAGFFISAAPTLPTAEKPPRAAALRGTRPDLPRATHRAKVATPAMLPR